MEKMNNELEILLNKTINNFIAMDKQQRKKYILSIKNDTIMNETIKLYILSFYLEAYRRTKN